MKRLFPVLILVAIVLLQTMACSTDSLSPTMTATVVPVVDTPTIAPKIAPATPVVVPSPSSYPSDAIAEPTPTQTSQIGKPPTGKRGGRLTIASPVDPPHLDVHQDVSESLTSLGPGLAYSRLLRLRMGPMVSLPDMSLECDLCASWELQDPMTYVFHLRQNVQWQDVSLVPSRSLVANDLIFSYERMRQQGWIGESLLDGVKDITALNDYTVKISLKYPNVDFLHALADGHAKIVFPDSIPEGGDLKKGPIVGTGPWVWKKTVQGIGSNFERNPTYFENPLPFLDRLDVRVIRDEKTRLVALLTKGVDLTPLSVEEQNKLDERSGTDIKQTLFREQGKGLLLVLNTSIKPFNTLELRTAVFKALDPWDTLDVVWKGHGYVSVGVPVMKSDWLLSKEEIRDIFADPSSGRKMIQKFSEKAPITFDLVVADFGDIYLQNGQRIYKELEAVGFQPTMRILNPRQYAEQVWRDGNYQAFVGPMPPVSTINGFLIPLLRTGGRWSKAIGFTDPVLDRLIDIQAVEQDSIKRAELIHHVQKEILEHRFLFSPVTSSVTWGLWPRVQQFYPNFSLSEYFFWARVSVE